MQQFRNRNGMQGGGGGGFRVVVNVSRFGTRYEGSGKKVPQVIIEMNEFRIRNAFDDIFSILKGTLNICKLCVSRE